MLNAVRMYLERRSVRLTDAVPLFVNVEGNRLSRFGLRYIMAHRVSLLTRDQVISASKKRVHF
jgi:hypothetical protein